jgi:hypothetical protein
MSKRRVRSTRAPFSKKIDCSYGYPVLSEERFHYVPLIEIIVLNKMSEDTDGHVYFIVFETRNRPKAVVVKKVGLCFLLEKLSIFGDLRTD